MGHHANDTTQIRFLSLTNTFSREVSRSKVDLVGPTENPSNWL